MYKLLFVFFIGFLSAQQKCNIVFSNGQFLQDDNTIFFRLKNVGKEKVTIPKRFNANFARPTDIQVYDSEKNDYIDTMYSFDEALCGDVRKCFGRMIYLKQGKSKEYKVKIIPGRISKALKEKKKYRFKLSFDTYLFSDCNDYVTDWLYYQN